MVRDADVAGQLKLLCELGLPLAPLKYVSNMNEFCSKVADVLDVPQVSETDVLADFPEWDSLSVLSVVAMLDSNYGVNLSATDLKGIRTVADLWDLIQSRARR